MFTGDKIKQTAGVKFRLPPNYDGTVGGNMWTEIAHMDHGPLIKGDRKRANPWWYGFYYCGLPDKFPGSKVLQYNRFSTDPNKVVTQWSPVGITIANNSSGFDSTVYNTALDRLNEKVRGTLDLSIDIAQANQVRSMLTKTNRLTRLVTDIVRKDPLAVTRDISELWLEWRYGVKPLLQDIFDATQELQNQANNLTRFVTATASRREPAYSDWTWTYVAGNNTQFVHRFKTRAELFDACRITVELYPLEANRYARWTSLNPISIGWELVPFSFVADWFYDIGGYLRNYETALLYGRAFRSGYVSQLKVQVYTSKGGNFDAPDGTTLAETGDLFTKIVAFDRTLLSSYPRPIRPKFKVDLGSGRLLNAAALLGSLLRKS